VVATFGRPDYLPPTKGLLTAAAQELLVRVTDVLLGPNLTEEDTA